MDVLDVRMTDDRIPGVRSWSYQIWVGSKVYDEFTSTRPLTHSEQVDVLAGYREALSVG